MDLAAPAEPGDPMPEGLTFKEEDKQACDCFTPHGFKLGNDTALSQKLLNDPLTTDYSMENSYDKDCERAK